MLVVGVVIRKEANNSTHHEGDIRHLPCFIEINY